MNLLYELRDELMKRKLNGFSQFYLEERGKYFLIDDFIEEIDNLRICQCPPKGDLS